MRQTNITVSRERFKTLFDYYGGKNLVPERAQLRIEVPLRNGNGKYQFNIKKEILGPAEENLKRNDLFVMDSLFVGLIIETEGKEGFAPIQSFPMYNNGVFEGFGYFKGGADGNRDIEALYNGKLSIRTNQTEIVSGLPLVLFRKVTAKSDHNNDSLPQFDITDCALQLAERILFAGTQDYRIEIEFPATSASDFSTGINYSGNDEPVTKGKLVFLALGYKVPGGTNDPYSTDPNNPFKEAI